MRKHIHRHGRQRTNTVQHRARCKHCGDTVDFGRSPRDKRCGATNHLKHMHCYSCRRVTPHVQLGRVVS